MGVGIICNRCTRSRGMRGGGCIGGQSACRLVDLADRDVGESRERQLAHGVDRVQPAVSLWLVLGPDDELRLGARQRGEAEAAAVEVLGGVDALAVGAGDEQRVDGGLGGAGGDLGADEQNDAHHAGGRDVLLAVHQHAGAQLDPAVGPLAQRVPHAERALQQDGGVAVEGGFLFIFEI